LSALFNITTLLRPSKMARAIFIGLYTVAALSVLWASITICWKAALLSALSCFGMLLKHKITEFRYDDCTKQCEIQFQQGEKYCAVVSNIIVLYTKILLIRLNGKKPKTLLLFEDNMDKRSFHRLLLLANLTFPY